MAKRNVEIRVGTSGWSYNHWKEIFYPTNISQHKWLEYYSNNFDTVELNNSFYQLPKETSFKRWYNTTPDNFKYTVKASKYITHVKKLNDCNEPLNNFLERAYILKEKLGPILFQLPPSFKFNPERLESFLNLLPGKIIAVFEFRNETWFNDTTFDLLNQYKAVYCVHDMISVPRNICAKKIYLRLHGAGAKYAGNYSSEQLKKWAEWIIASKPKITHAFVYFNNDENAYAIFNAKKIKEHLHLK